MALCFHCYFVATLDLIHIDIVPQRDNNSAKAFLKQMKSMGFDFHTIATDCCPIYDQAIADIFPEAKHAHCILHMGRSVRNRLMKVFGSYNNKTFKELAPLLSAIYQAKEEDTFEKA